MRRWAASGVAVLAALAPALAEDAPPKSPGQPPVQLSVQLPATAADQTYPVGQAADAPQSPILTLDQDRLFTGSAFGKRVTAEIDAARKQLLAENHKIEAALAAEEKNLTEERATLAPAAFRKLADAFDAKVQKIRHDQDAKNRVISSYRDSERKRFFEVALPILGQLVRDSGAVAILNQQAIFLSFNAIDITDRAIARLDRSLGDGAKGAARLDLNTVVGPTGSGDAPVADGKN